MKSGVLFWGFKDLGVAVECAKRLKKIQTIKELYIQISTSEKTISLLDIFPEEIVRCEHDDLNFLFHWLKRNEKKSIIVVIDFWSFFLIKKFNDKLKVLKKVLDEPFCFLICCPKLYHNHYVNHYNNKLNTMADKTEMYFESVKLLHEMALNCKSQTSLFCSSPNMSLLNLLSGQEFFATKNISFINIVPALLKKYPSSFVGKKNYLDELLEKISEISVVISNTKNKNKYIPFRKYLKSDVINIHYKSFSKQRNNRFLMTYSLERFYKIKTKEENKLLLWSIYLGILDYMETYRVEPDEVFNKLFSNVSM